MRRAISASVIEGPPLRSRRSTAPSTMSRSAAGVCSSSDANSSALCAHQAGGDMHGAAGQHGGARRMRADAVIDAVGLAVDDAHAPVVDAERLGADLRHGGLETLAERGAAGDQLDRAAAVSTEILALSVGPRPLSSRKIAMPAPTASPAARRRSSSCLQLLPAERRQRLVEQRRVVAGIELQLLDAGLVERDGVRHLDAAIRLRRRTSTRSMPSLRATASISGSRTNVLSKRPGAR